MEQFTVQAIGVFKVDGEGFRVVLHPEYRGALAGLAGFRHLQTLWWFSHCDDAASRATRQEPCPYRGGPETLGTFATRSPQRPNPIGLSTAEVVHIDAETATIWLGYVDAEDGTPLLDIKPYTPSLDRVENPGVPAWCAHWPQSLEASADFDWDAEFNF